VPNSAIVAGSGTAAAFELRKSKPDSLLRVMPKTGFPSERIRDERSGRCPEPEIVDRVAQALQALLESLRR